MLKTNGSAAAREQYSEEAGAIVIIPSRTFTDRIPFGVARFKIWYRFAGQNIPGIQMRGVEHLSSTEIDVLDPQRLPIANPNLPTQEMIDAYSLGKTVC